MDQIHHHEHDHADVSAAAEDFAPLAALPSGFVPRVTTISAEEIAHANRRARAARRAHRKGSR